MSILCCALPDVIFIAHVYVKFSQVSDARKHVIARFLLCMLPFSSDGMMLICHMVDVTIDFIW